MIKGKQIEGERIEEKIEENKGMGRWGKGRGKKEEKKLGGIITPTLGLETICLNLSTTLRLLFFFMYGNFEYFSPRGVPFQGEKF